MEATFKQSITCQSLVKNPPFRSQPSRTLQPSFITMLLAYLIIRLQSTNPIAPSIDIAEAILCNTQSVISIPDPDYTSATLVSSLPRDPSTQVMFNISIGNRSGNFIDACEVHWTCSSAVMSLLKIATGEMLHKARLRRKFEFVSEGRRDWAGTHANLKHSEPDQFVSWKIIRVVVDDK
jgi:hypothetical protein